MLIGEIEAGKTTLINALFGKDETARKTQAIEYEPSLIPIYEPTRLRRI